MPPYPGMTPSFTSGWPNFALSAAILIAARHRQLAPTTQGKAVDCGDDRLAKVLDEVGQCLSPTSRLFRFYSCVVGDLRDVGARSKCFLTGAREDDSTDG